MKNRLLLSAISLVLFATNAIAQSRTGAQSVLQNARSLCVFMEGAGSWTVTCPPDLLARGQRLEFAKAIANADAYLTGRPRHISFLLLGNGLFAVADPRTGIREVANAASPVPPGKSKKVVLGTSADTVLEWRGKATSSVSIGRDDQGLLVEWRYPDFTYIMALRRQNGIEAYRVSKIIPANKKIQPIDSHVSATALATRQSVPIADQAVSAHASAAPPKARPLTLTATDTAGVFTIVDFGDCTSPDRTSRYFREINEKGGNLNLQLLISDEGRIADAKIAKSSGNREVDKASVVAISKCRFPDHDAISTGKRWINLVQEYPPITAAPQ
jgi:TonB family protein